MLARLRLSQSLAAEHGDEAGPALAAAQSAHCLVVGGTQDSCHDGSHVAVGMRRAPDREEDGLQHVIHQLSVAVELLLYIAPGARPIV